MSETRTTKNLVDVARLQVMTMETTGQEVSVSASNSIELSRNAKGDASWTIKLYFEPGAAEAMLKRIEKLDQLMSLKFKGAV